MTARWLLAPLGALLLGCVNENNIIDDLVLQYCETRWITCGCDGPDINQTRCESSETRMGGEAQTMAQQAGLTFDRKCARRWLERTEPVCTPYVGSGNPTQCYPDHCSIYHGTVLLQQPCMSFGEWSNCAQGFICGIQGRCEDPCAGQRRGDQCFHGDYTSGCLGDMVCTADHVCGDAPAIGEPCHQMCARGAICEDNACVAGGSLDDPCDFDSDCGNGYHCTGGTCSVGPFGVCMVDLPW